MVERMALDEMEDEDAVIRRVLAETRTVAVVGASPRPERDSFAVMRFMQSRGYRVLPVNPAAAGSEILGETCHPSLADLPGPVDMVDIFRRSDAAGAVVDEALSMSPPPRVIWMQLGVRDDAAAARARSAGLTVVMDRCPKIEYPRLLGHTI